MRSAIAAWLFLAAASPLAAPSAQQEGPRVYEPGLVSTGHDDAHVAFTPDGGTMFFLRNTPDFAHWTVMMSRRTGRGWAPPQVAPFSGRWSDADVFVTRDGGRLFFVSTRPVQRGTAKGDTDIWMMTRTANGWSEPRWIPELASPGFEWFPTLTDAGTIYFGSERAGGQG